MPMSDPDLMQQSDTALSVRNMIFVNAVDGIRVLVRGQGIDGRFGFNEGYLDVEETKRVLAFLVGGLIGDGR